MFTVSFAETGNRKFFAREMRALCAARASHADTRGRCAKKVVLGIFDSDHFLAVRGECVRRWAQCFAS